MWPLIVKYLVLRNNLRFSFDDDFQFFDCRFLIVTIGKLRKGSLDHGLIRSRYNLSFPPFPAPTINLYQNRHGPPFSICRSLIVNAIFQEPAPHPIPPFLPYPSKLMYDYKEIWHIQLSLMNGMLPASLFAASLIF